MTSFLQWATVAIAVFVVINLMLTLRLVRWISVQKETRLKFMQVGPDLQVGARAPSLRARTLGGTPVTLDDYAGARTVFIFSSPFCDLCREEMPQLQAMSVDARRNDDTQIVIVSDADSATTRIWLRTMSEDDHVTVDLPVLAAPTTETSFTSDYNPQGAIPFFVSVDGDGLVASHGRVGESAWQDMARAWKSRRGLASWMTANR